MSAEDLIVTSRRFLSIGLPLLAGFMAGSALARAQAPAKIPPAPSGFELGGDPERGKAVYAKSCAVCHGAAGDGKGKVAETMNPRPTDFQDARYMARRSDWELYLAVRDGGKAVGLSSKMFAWKGLIPDQSIHDAVAYIRTLAR